MVCPRSTIASESAAAREACEAPARTSSAMTDIPPAYGINSGTGRAAKVLHRILGLPDNARMSDSVIAAAGSGATGDLIVRLCEERLRFLQSLRTWPVFGAGWSRRVREVKAAALVMASHPPVMGAPVIPPPPDIPARDISPTAPKTGASIIAAIISVLAIFRKRK